VVLRPPAVAVSILGLGLYLGTPAAHPQRPPGAVQTEGTIYGRVEVDEALPRLARRPRVAELGGGIDHRPSEPAPSVVYLQTAPSGEHRANGPRRAIMDQRHETFVPHVLAVTVGTTVEFPNSDLVYHNVFSLSKAARFDLGRYAVGRSKAIRFDKPGVVRVFCDIHSHMNAFILVFDHPFFSVTDNAGRFRISGVPTGTYGAIVWREGDSSGARPVTVPEGGATELNFTWR